MPCFKGLAVSIHTPDGPLPEYSIQKQSKFSRITSYIPVPPAKSNSTTGQLEQSTFAISITLLTPGLPVPYSAPKATENDPFPQPKTVGGLPGLSGERGQYTGVISPYIPLTTSPNETIAAYIYFDGRKKEEVATLLRRGEETWVNSRWVAVPDSEGGGLAEREFLFREVGLDRWLNWLHLEGKEVGNIIERRKQKKEARLKKLQAKQKEQAIKQEGDADMDIEAEDDTKKTGGKDVLKYGVDANSPLAELPDEDLSSDSDSDFPDMPEATGQIKVALFRVLASGEIKKGEYSPQFDAHDDDEGSEGKGATANGDADIDHTTSFAKPKALDPKSISTQTVTGIDGPDKPYATFTFLYRGERQLQKMGILPSSKPAEKPTPTTSKRRSVQTDFANLPPLKAGGTVGFSTFRESAQDASNKRRSKSSKKRTDSDDDDDDDDDEIVGTMEDIDTKEDEAKPSPRADAEHSKELAEGVRKIKLKRQHSSDLLDEKLSAARASPPSNSPTAGSRTPPRTAENGILQSTPDPRVTQSAPDEGIVGSPLKKQRSSIPGINDEIRHRIGMGFAESMGNVLGSSDEAESSKAGASRNTPSGGDDEEL